MSGLQGFGVLDVRSIRSFFEGHKSVKKSAMLEIVLWCTKANKTFIPMLNYDKKYKSLCYATLVLFLENKTKMTQLLAFQKRKIGNYIAICGRTSNKAKFARFALN